MKLDAIIALAMELEGLITAHLAALWPGLAPVPFILYDDRHQVAVGPRWPERYTLAQPGIWVAYDADSALMGNTATLYHGVLAAVWDTRTWPQKPDAAVAASGMAHEMFHAFQHTHMKLPGANELLMPQYPHSARSLALVAEENRLLFQIGADPAREAVARAMEHIARLRGQREEEIGGKFMSYDLCCESVEGTAAYVEAHMLARLTGVSPFETAAAMLPTLLDEAALPRHYRRRCYGAGLMLALAADVLWPGWQARWADKGSTLYGWMQTRLAPAQREVHISAAQLEAAHGRLCTFRQAEADKIDAFLSGPWTALEGTAKLVGFDPMNLTYSNGRCLHQHGRVRLGDRELLLETPFLVECGDSILEVKRILISERI